ncbi:GNAT family N-acetyltransferase [Eubacteriales bacterium OttesenSCG-928-K08]|nr:GNAT family N-acetyltransferase [Eubacteriales bacterium OttesenSCG-928-K08]
MFASEFSLGPGGAKDALYIRRLVFVDELGLDEQFVFDDKDAFCAHLTVRMDGEPIASGRMASNERGVNIEFICVKKDFRGQGFGDMCLRTMLNKAQSMGATNAYVHVPERYKAYYEAFGFREFGRGQNEYVNMVVETAHVDWHPNCGGHGG